MAQGIDKMIIFHLVYSLGGKRSAAVVIPLILNWPPLLLKNQPARVCYLATMQSSMVIKGVEHGLLRNSQI